MLIFIGFFYQNALAQYEGYTPSPDNAYWYKYIERGNGATVDSGLVVEVLVHQYIENPDTIFIDREFPGPQPALLKNPSTDPILGSLMGKKVGDSVSIIVPIKGVLATMMPSEIVESGAWMRTEFRVLLVEEEEVYVARKEKELKDAVEQQRVIDEEKIEAYFKENNLEGFQRTESGIYYKLESSVEGELSIQALDRLTVHYKGTLLSGEVFDSSYERESPFEFTIGVGRVIKGWDEGFMLFKKGQSGTLIIPSRYGYGPRESGSIPANSILVFDIEVINVEIELAEVEPFLEIEVPESEEEEDLEDKKYDMLDITIDASNEINVEGEKVQLNQLKATIKKFITDNTKEPTSFEEASRTIPVSIFASRDASYSTYVAVRKELKQSFYELRAEYLGVSVKEYLEIERNKELPQNKEKYERATARFPLLIFDVEPTKD